MALERVVNEAKADIPVSTYRMQFHAKFRLADATELVPYLAALGVSHLYASSYLKARSGSEHGYDIVDHNALNPEIGDEADHARLCETLSAAGIKQLLDVVPNHMGVLTPENRWWTDVVEHGRSSPWSRYFDIDWSAPTGSPARQLLLPVLDAQYGQVLESGRLRLYYDKDSKRIAVLSGELSVPIDPSCYSTVLSSISYTGPSDIREQLSGLMRGFEDLPPTSSDAKEMQMKRHDDALALREQLAALVRDDRSVSAWVDASVARFNGTEGDARSFDALDDLIARQPWRLAYWRVAAHEVNYRRFFEVSSLAAIRVEEREVFDATHRTVLRWLREGKIAALRIDHPDGLAEPAQYFERLQSAFLGGQGDRVDPSQPPKALYLALEKILASHERWPDTWQAHGDTGYRFASLVNGLFVDASHRGAFDALYEDFIGRKADYEAELLAAKRYVINKLLASDLHYLTESSHALAQTSRVSRDFTRVGLRQALIELACGMTVYRTYSGENGADEADRRQLESAAGNARRHAVLDEEETLNFLVDLLLAPHASAERLAFIRRFQQFTSPVMAKSMEDTAFYRYHRLISLNDVGADPTQFGIEPEAFHDANAARQRQLPHCMLGTSTHDSKRSEDVRARLDVLSEMPDEWQAALRRWRALRERQAPGVPGAPPLEPNDEVLLYQSMVGIWPAGEVDDAMLEDVRTRLKRYMGKAMREAKQITSWLRPNTAYEEGVMRCIDTLLGTLSPNPFLADLRDFVERVAPRGFANCLAQVVLKLTSPGVPDIYQGCESWNFSLVDPDNRRPVDFSTLQAQLSQLRSGWYEHDGLSPAMLDDLLANLPDGRLKLLVTWRLLAWRARVPALFENGAYLPLKVTGPAARHVIAFARLDEAGGTACVTLAARFVGSLGENLVGLSVSPEAWGDTRIELPAANEQAPWQDVITGRRRPACVNVDASASSIRAADAFALLPVSVLSNSRR